MNTSRLAAYEQSTLDYLKLQRYAQRVAREAKKPRELVTKTKVVRVAREVHSGFFGLRRSIVFDDVEQRYEAPQDHWLLMSRFWNREDSSRHLLEDTARARMSYCLQTNGELVVAVESWEEKVTREGRYIESQHETSTRPFDERDVSLFDFEAKYYETYGKKPKIWTNQDNSSKLLVHSKGVGLSLALKKLLEP